MEQCCGRKFAEQASFDGHQSKVHPHPARIQVTSVAQLERDLSDFLGDRAKRGDWVKAEDRAKVGQGVQGAPDFVLGKLPELPYSCADCGRGFITEMARDLHEDLVKHGAKVEKAAQDQADLPESWDDIRALVREQLVERYRDPGQNYCYIWVADMSSDWVVFELKDQYYKTTYTLDDDGGVSFGDNPVEVIRRTIYVPAPADPTP